MFLRDGTRPGSPWIHTHYHTITLENLVFDASPTHTAIADNYPGFYIHHCGGSFTARNCDFLRSSFTEAWFAYSDECPGQHSVTVEDCVFDGLPLTHHLEH